jgi:hypothetical protein
MKHDAAARTILHRTLGVLGTGVLLASGAVVATASPAAAISSVTTSGTTLTVTFTGTETLTLTCVGGKATANGATGTPAIACASLTKVIVNGDSGAQNVDGEQLEHPAFTAKPSLTVALGAGADIVYETSRADTLDLGAGNDRLYLAPDSTVNNYELGADNDWVGYFGDPYVAAVDTVVASSTNTKLVVTRKVGAATGVSNAFNAEQFGATGFGGNDVFDLGGIVAGSSITGTEVYAGDGDDTLIGSQLKNTLEGGPGKNSFVGGAGTDTIFSLGNQDTIDGKGGTNWIYDRRSGKSGRTIANGGASSWHVTEVESDDSVARIRPGTLDRVTHSLARPGQQVLPSAFQRIVAYHGYDGGLDSRGLFDVVVPDGGVKVSVDGDKYDNDLLDVTIPSGSWTTTISGGSGWIKPTSDAFEDIQVADIGEVKVHGPWTDKNKGFAHRVTRDLMFRFASDADINTTGAALAAGSTSRPAVVASLMDTDEYRGLDVDRVFVRYLNRNVDPAGREYWVDSLDSGKALWRFRAQLFGSNEYFTKAGGTNAAFVDRAYFDVLGRLPDPSGRAYWTNKLNAGANRGSVALQFIGSSEFRRYIVDDQFLRFLDRKATPAEQDTWAPKITGTATGEQDLIAFLAAGAEYYGRT